MRFLANCTLTALLFLGATSAARADRTISTYDHKVDFSKYHTYSWGTVSVANPIYAGSVKQSVNWILQAKGWRLVPSGGEATISVRDRVQPQKELKHGYMNPGDGWGDYMAWGGWSSWGDASDASSTPETAYVPVGKLVLKIFDGSSHILLWRGSAVEKLSDKSSKNNKKLAKDISALLRDFPPEEAAR
jgi:hypothetical protein